MQFIGRCADFFSDESSKNKGREMNKRVLPGIVLLAVGAYFGFVVALANFNGITSLGLGLSSGIQATIAALCAVAGGLFFLTVDDVGESTTAAGWLAGAGIVCLVIGSYIGLF